MSSLENASLNVTLKRSQISQTSEETASQSRTLHNELNSSCMKSFLKYLSSSVDDTIPLRCCLIIVSMLPDFAFTSKCTLAFHFSLHIDVAPLCASRWNVHRIPQYWWPQRNAAPLLVYDPKCAHILNHVLLHIEDVYNPLNTSSESSPLHSINASPLFCLCWSLYLGSEVQTLFFFFSTFFLRT